MVQRRSGKPAGQKKINEMLKYATSRREAYYLLVDGRLNLTNPEINKIVDDWDKMQNILKVHGKGAYVAPCVQVVA